MSIQIQKEILETAQKAVQLHDAMHKKTGEMIELMKIVRMDALRRRNQYKKIVKELEAGRLQEMKNLFREMLSWKKYKIEF